MIPRRVAYVVKHFPKFSETFIASELVELQRRDIQVCILALREPTIGLRHDFITDAGLDRATTYGVEKFADVLEKFRPDLIHAHFATEATAEARRLAARFAVPFTFTAHGYDIYRDPPPDFRDRVCASAGLITVSEANARYISHNFDVPLARINVIAPGVDTSRFRPRRAGDDFAESFNSDGVGMPGPIVCVARYEPAKNLGLLLRVCSILRDRGVDFRCVMIGEGGDREAIESTRTELGLDKVVELAGAVEQNHVIGFLQRATISVLTSDREGMPVCLMEAGACEVPVVATSVGGIPELIEHEVTGLLTPPGNAESFADSVQRLLSDRDLRRRMGTAARRRIEARFSLRRQMDRMLDMWSRCVTI
jgi:glycosyltransferase involved in cell wall biosynthesis